MPERLFLFIQLEFPWRLGPADGRYLLRKRGGQTPTQLSELSASETGEPERVIVLGTLGAGRRAELGAAPVGEAPPARRPRATTPDPAPVDTMRATIIDPVSLSAERQAQAWLAEIDAEREIARGRRDAQPRPVRPPHRRGGSPYPRGLPRPGARDSRRLGRRRAGRRRVLAVRARASLGTLLARPAPAGRRCLRPQERLAELLGARGQELLCEELALRARLDLDHGRLPHAAFELDGALAAALDELGDETARCLPRASTSCGRLRVG